MPANVWLAPIHAVAAEIRDGYSGNALVRGIDTGRL
jgi:hypothetical protein